MAIPSESKDKICKLLDDTSIVKLWQLKSMSNDKIIEIFRQSLALDDDIRKNIFQSVFVQAKNSETILNEPEFLLLRYVVFNGGVITLKNFTINTGIDSDKVRDAVRGLEDEEEIIMSVVLHRNVKILVLYKEGIRKYLKRNEF